MIQRRDFLKLGGLSLTLPALLKTAGAQTTGRPAGPAGPAAGLAPLGPEDYEERRERAGGLMAANRLDAVFVSGGGRTWSTSRRSTGGRASARSARS